MAGFSLDREISFTKQIPFVGPHVANALQRTQDAINQLGTNLAAAPTGTMPAPPPINGVDVKANNGLLHVTINDQNAIQRGINYFVEHSTRSDFVGAHVVDLHSSRGGTIPLPGLDDNGNPQAVFVRAYSQYRAGNPGTKIHFGGTTPTAVLPGGTTQMTLLPSTGSGTAAPNGQQQGSGLGKTLFRPAQAPKRQS
jgi:hypothetical protein